MSDSEWEDVDDLDGPTAPVVQAPQADVKPLAPSASGPAPSLASAAAPLMPTSALMPSNATPAALAGAAAAAAVKPEVKLDIPVHERSRLAASARAAYLKQLDEYESAALNALEQEMGFTVGGAVDLTKLVLYAPNAEIDKRRRPNVHIRVRNPHCSVQVNPSGFVSILGGKTRSELYLASRTVATMIKRSGAFPEARIQGFLINNIVLSCKTGRPLRRDLVEVQLQKLGIDAYSEQEIFPCVRVNLTYPKKHSCKVFRTGAFIVMGLTEIADSILSFKTFYDVIQKLPKTGAHEAVSYGRFQARDVPSGFDPDSEAAAAAGEAPRLNFDEYAAGANAEVKEEDDFTMEHIEM